MAAYSSRSRLATRTVARRYRSKRRSNVRNRRPYRRSYRRKRRSVMSNRRILNVSSRKKRNTMLSWSNTSGTGASRPVAPGAAVVNTSGAIFLWCATAQTLDGNSTVANTSSRTASSCYMRGLSEHLRIQTNSGTPWFHRRICFAFRSAASVFTSSAATDNPTQANSPYVDTTNGIERLWLNETINNVQNTIEGQQNFIFKGVINVDWNDLIVAPVDTTRVDLKFDKTWTIHSGNASGVVRERKLWHPMNKNLVYDDDESGDSMVARYYSVDSKLGMGDYFVMDIIQAGSNAQAGDLLSINANSSLYWHEK